MSMSWSEKQTGARQSFPISLGLSHLAAAGCSHARNERLGVLLVDEVEGGARAHVRLEAWVRASQGGLGLLRVTVGLQGLGGG
jgi:hypothetical protein